MIIRKELISKILNPVLNRVSPLSTARQYIPFQNDASFFASSAESVAQTVGLHHGGAEARSRLRSDSYGAQGSTSASVTSSERTVARICAGRDTQVTIQSRVIRPRPAQIRARLLVGDGRRAGDISPPLRSPCLSASVVNLLSSTGVFVRRSHFHNFSGITRALNIRSQRPNFQYTVRTSASAPLASPACWPISPRSETGDTGA